MRLLVVPTSLTAAINKKLDAAYVEHPDATIDREHHYQALLNYFDEHGVIPDFQLTKKV